MLQKRLEGDRLLPFERLGVVGLDVSHPNTVHDDEVGLRVGVWGDGFQLVRVDDPDASTLHLLEEDAALHGPHEHDNLNGPDVRPGGDHVHGDRDTRLEAVAERLNEVSRVRGRHLVGDLLTEGVAPTELVAHDSDDVLGVTVVLGEDQGFRHLSATGEDVREEAVAEGADNCARVMPS